MSEIRKTDIFKGFTRGESKLINEYIEAQLPGYGGVTQADLMAWFNLYMDGKTYEEISSMTSSNKSIILYSSFKFNWFDKKQEYLGDIFNNMSKKLTQVKLSSINSLTTATIALSKYFENQFNEYLKNNDADVINNLDSRLLSQYYKSIDTLEKLVTPKRDSSRGSAPNNAIPDASLISNIIPPIATVGKDGEIAVEGIGDNDVEKRGNEKKIKITKENAGDILKKLAQVKKKSSD